jgi:hypothetical protein
LGRKAASGQDFKSIWNWLGKKKQGFTIVINGYGELSVILLLAGGLPGPERIAPMAAGAGALEEFRF